MHYIWEIKNRYEFSALVLLDRLELVIQSREALLLDKSIVLHITRIAGNLFDTGTDSSPSRV